MNNKDLKLNVPCHFHKNALLYEFLYVAYFIIVFVMFYSEMVSELIHDFFPPHVPSLLFCPSLAGQM